ncbi:MAG: hypothetical protein HYS34_06620 [Acidobacteria bacterium]|nr:hypothetical protein [Acidobacteriota bacterium]
MTGDGIRGRILLLFISILVLGAAAFTPTLARSYWFHTYERVVALIDSGRTGEAAPLLEQLIREHPYPIACLKVPGDRCIDYLPYFQRARLQFHDGDVRGAAYSLEISEAFGAIFQNRRTERAFLDLRRRIRSMAPADLRGPFPATTWKP